MTMTNLHQFLMSFVFSGSAALGCAGHPNDNPSTVHEGTIDMNAAREIALKAAPGKVLEAEREDEDGHDIYSFDIDPQDGSGNLREVHVDAKTGEVLRVETETPADEKREKAEGDDDDDDDDDDDKD